LERIATTSWSAKGALVIAAQPSGLGIRTADAKALKARFIGLAIGAFGN
jgi:hypothetical protein